MAEKVDVFQINNRFLATISFFKNITRLSVCTFYQIGLDYTDVFEMSQTPCSMRFAFDVSLTFACFLSWRSSSQSVKLIHFRTPRVLVLCMRWQKSSEETLPPYWLLSLWVP